MFEHRGVRIDIDQHGTFSCRIDDATITAQSLEDCKKKIDQELSKAKKRELALNVAAIIFSKDSGSFGFAKDAKVAGLTLTGVNRTSREFQYSDLPKGYDASHVVPFTDDNVGLLRRYCELKHELTAIERQLNTMRIATKGYGRIEVSEYDAVLSSIEASYEKVLAGQLSTE